MLDNPEHDGGKSSDNKDTDVSTKPSKADLVRLKLKHISSYVMRQIRDSLAASTHRSVMAGLVSAIHDFLIADAAKQDVDARHKAGHDVDGAECDARARGFRAACRSPRRSP